MFKVVNDYPVGANITILNTLYMKPARTEDGKWTKGKMIVLYKDLDTGKKHIEEVDDPKYVYYKANDDQYIDHSMLFIEESKVHPIEVPFRDLVKSIASETGNEEFYYENINNRNGFANNQLHTIPSIFNSDMNLEDAWRMYFDKQFTNNIFTITKGYIDIEVDTNYQLGDFPEMGECPINLLSYVDTKNKMVSLFILKDDSNPQVQMLEDNTNPELFEELRNFVINHVGGDYRAKKLGIYDLQYQFFFYDSEIDLIRDSFRMIHWSGVDFVLAWNMPFDIPYIIERVKALGYDPAEILSDPRVITKYANYWIDEKNRQMPAQRGDTFDIAGYVIFLDQLVHFASRRKGQSAFENMKLDYIGQKVTKVGKLSWSHIAKSFSEFIRKDFKTFAFYNIMDTLVQMCIENKVGDIDYVFNKCLINNTRYSKCHRQTVYLTNRGVKEFAKDGFIMGNNNNRGNEKPPKFPGALVGDPLNNSDYCKRKINGVAVNIADNLDDFDYKSLYPSIMREFNIAPNTQIGQIIIDQVVFANENPFKYDKYCRGGQFTSDLHSQNIIQFANRWLHLGTYRDIMNDLLEYIQTYGIEDTRKPINPTYMIRIDVDKSIVPLVSFNKEEKVNKPLVVFYPEEKSFDDELAWLREHAQMDIDDIEMIMRRKARENSEDFSKFNMED